MPDRYGRLTGRERVSAALLRLCHWEASDLSGESPGLAQAIRVAKGAGANLEDIAGTLGAEVAAVEAFTERIEK